jgi:UDP-2,3-diacylglucosamine pyrophosphatase LpxH
VATEVGEALQRLAARPGVTVLYLVGNHDSALAWDGMARKLVADRFGVTDFALHARVRVQRADGPGEVVVVAEHGDALDPWNRRTDPFDPLDVPVGDHVVNEFVNRLEAASGRYPQLALDEVDNVRPGLLVPWWLVSNFFYKFMGRALRDFALPLVLLTIALNLVVGLLVGDLGRIAYLGNRAVRWVSSFVLTNLALLAVLSTFLGRSFRRAAAAYGLPSPDEASEEAESRQGELPELLERRDPDATVLLTGHTHEPRVVRLPGGRVAVDGGCWVRGLVPVRAWLSLPPVFVPTYPVNWVDVQSTPDGVEVTLWERRLAVARRLGRIERLVARRPLPPADAAPPTVAARVVVPA